MTRIARTFGPFLGYGPNPIQNYAAYSALIEASPIYTEIEVSLRIWGTRSAGATTQTIDQTETLTLTRQPITPAGTIEASEQISFYHLPGRIVPGIAAPYGRGLPLAFSASAALAYEGASNAVVFRLPWSDVFFNTLGIPYSLPFDNNFGAFFGLPDFKRPRLICDSGATRTFHFSQVTPPGDPVDVPENVYISSPRWGSLTPIPAGQRGSPMGWGYSVDECIDTAAWSPAQWRDYRGTHVLPAQSLVTGVWTSGDMQRQLTITLS